MKALKNTEMIQLASEALNSEEEKTLRILILKTHCLFNRNIEKY